MGEKNLSVQADVLVSSVVVPVAGRDLPEVTPGWPRGQSGAGGAGGVNSEGRREVIVTACGPTDRGGSGWSLCAAGACLGGRYRLDAALSVSLAGTHREQTGGPMPNSRSNARADRGLGEGRRLRGAVRLGRGVTLRGARGRALARRLGDDGSGRCGLRA